MPAYVILDGAQNQTLLGALHADHAPPWRCLFTGQLEPDMAVVAPYLVELEHSSAFTRRLLAEGWGQNWGVFLTSQLALPALWRHVRQQVHVYGPNMESLFFRFYDPRVMRNYLPTCPRQAAGRVLRAGRLLHRRGRGAGARARLVGGRRQARRARRRLEPAFRRPLESPRGACRAGQPRKKAAMPSSIELNIGHVPSPRRQRDDGDGDERAVPHRRAGRLLRPSARRARAAGRAPAGARGHRQLRDRVRPPRAAAPRSPACRTSWASRCASSSRRWTSSRPTRARAPARAGARARRRARERARPRPRPRAPAPRTPPR